MIADVGRTQILSIMFKIIVFILADQIDYIDIASKYFNTTIKYKGQTFEFCAAICNFYDEVDDIITVNNDLLYNADAVLIFYDTNHQWTKGRNIITAIRSKPVNRLYPRIAVNYRLAAGSEIVLNPLLPLKELSYYLKRI